MSRFILVMSGLEKPELVATSFSHPRLATELHSVRGREPSIHEVSGSFQWTSAAQALTVLMLKTAASRRGLNVVPVLQGSVGSLASSLDFALTKLPSWLLEMFGRDNRGCPLARAILHRSNSGLKHTGPVVIGIGGFARKELQVEVRVGTSLLTDSAQIIALASQIESAWRPHHIARVPSKKHQAATSERRPEMLPARFVERFTTRALGEVMYALRATNIFSRDGLLQAVGEIVDNPSFIKIAGKRRELFAACEMDRLRSGHCGYFSDLTRLDRALRTDGSNIRVALGTVPSAFSVIFEDLVCKGYSICIDADDSDASDKVARIENNSYAVPPDLISLGIATAAEVVGRLAHRGYHPIMVGPKHSARFISKVPIADANNLKLNEGRILCHYASPSSGTFYLEALHRAGVLRRRRVDIQHGSPAKMFEELRQGDPELRVIVHFPNHDLNVMFNGCSYLDSAHVQSAYFPGVLFAHESLIAQQERLFCLIAAFRNSWLTLRDDSERVQQLIAGVLAGPGYLERVLSISGIADALGYSAKIACANSVVDCHT